jgi:hypothetical protein
VIKELKNGFKYYIPLALCPHKVCMITARSINTHDDTRIEMNDKGEIRLKQKTLTAARNYWLSTADFTGICENFIHRMQKYLVMGNDEALRPTPHELLQVGWMTSMARA